MFDYGQLEIEGIGDGVNDSGNAQDENRLTVARDKEKQREIINVLHL